MPQKSSPGVHSTCEREAVSHRVPWPRGRRGGDFYPHFSQQGTGEGDGPDRGASTAGSGGGSSESRFAPHGTGDQTESGQDRGAPEEPARTQPRRPELEKGRHAQDGSASSSHLAWGSVRFSLKMPSLWTLFCVVNIHCVPGTSHQPFLITMLDVSFSPVAEMSVSGVINLLSGRPGVWTGDYNGALSPCGRDPLETALLIVTE